VRGASGVPEREAALTSGAPQCRSDVLVEVTVPRPLRGWPHRRIMTSPSDPGMLRRVTALVALWTLGAGSRSPTVGQPLADLNECSALRAALLTAGGAACANVCRTGSVKDESTRHNRRTNSTCRSSAPSPGSCDTSSSAPPSSMIEPAVSTNSDSSSSGRR
jgi:hypothetical protein